MASHDPDLDEPLLEWVGDTEPDVLDDQVAKNDEWAYRKADQLVARLPQRTGQDRRTEGEVFDRITLLTLHKLLRGGVLRSLDFPVSTGKEANVFRGTTPEGSLAAVKIFRINTATFKHVLKYVQGDERFSGVTGDKKSLVYTWTQKEFRNLRRMREAGVDVPEPWRVLNNVLMTEYIGVEEGPWPTLKSVGRLPDPEPFWDKLADDYITMVNDAGLVHADLSEFNVLVENADRMQEPPEDDPARAPRPRIIDVGQAVLRNHPMAREFLERDVKNLTHYFRRQGLKVDPDRVLQRVTLDKEVDLE